MSKFLFPFILFISFATYNCTESLINTNNLDPKPQYSILFIGNSLTYTNNLPKLVRHLAKKKGIRIKTNMVAYPNYALIDHWNEGKIQIDITNNKYDFVVIQQGPSSQLLAREVLIEYGKRLTDLCEENNARLCYFMVWPSVQYYSTFDDVIKNHKDAATINNALLCPVGEVWKKHFDITGNFDYYGIDNFHPSLKGSIVAAQVIVETLFFD